VSTRRVCAPLRRYRLAAPESLTLLGVVEDRVRTVDGVFDLGIATFRCLPVFFERGPRCPDPRHFSLPSGEAISGVVDVSRRLGHRRT
jgi:hypothetical protein